MVASFCSMAYCVVAQSSKCLESGINWLKTVPIGFSLYTGFFGLNGQLLDFGGKHSETH